jgi:predicted ATPase/DNA-binding SARP family transcriptional activator
VHVVVRLMGGFEVTVDGVHVPAAAWRRRSASDLVGLLALQRARRLRREQVIDALWPDLLVDEAAPRLHKAAHFARSALGDRGAVVAAGDFVALFPDADVTVDVDAFDAAAEAARARHRPEVAEAAVRRYGGDLLPDHLYEPWAADAREQRRLRYLELLAQAGRWDDLVAADPADEQAHLNLAQEHVRRGDRQAALRALDRMADLLRRELDVEPGETALALRREALALPARDVDRPARVAPRWTPVPVPPTATVGRSDDIDVVLRLLDRARLVTVLGPGGVGKTRLAAEVALRHSRDDAVDACFVDLTKVADAGLVPELVSRELGLHAGPSGGWEAALGEVLHDRPALLVLDNFEHVVDAADVVSRLVAGSPDLRVLVTSRVRLRLAGEHVHDVAPLPTATSGRSDVARLPEAVALFAQVASAVDPAFDLARHLSDVQAICAAVDGLPLAIELAAGHVRTLPPALLRGRLGARLSSPLAAVRDSPDRQRTVPATIDWSLQLLGPAERRLFCRLGVFAGAVPLDAVEHVCADEGADVVEVLGRLVDASLVRRVVTPSGELCFGLLELVRERARLLLAEAEHARLRRRHTDYVVSVLEELDERRWTDAAPHWLDAITRLLPEVRAAHDWAASSGDTGNAVRITAALGTFWHREGHHAEGRLWVAHALEHVEPENVHLVGRVHLAAGFLQWARDPVAAGPHWSAATELFRSLGHDRYLSYALALTSATYVGDDAAYDVALRLCDEGIELARSVGERPLLAQALNIKGELARVHGDDALALAVYEEGRALASAAGDDAHLSIFLANLAYLAAHAGDAVTARRLGCQALRLCSGLGHRMMAAWTVSELAGPELLLGRPERAALLVGAADDALRRMGATRHPGDRSEHARVVRELHDSLDPRRLAALLTQGQQLSLDAAVELALSEADGVTTGSSRVALPASRAPADTASARAHPAQSAR